MPTTQPPDAAAANAGLADAWACFDQGRLDDAIRVTRHIIQQAPHSLPHAYAALGFFLLSSGAIAEAEALLASAIGRHPEHAPLHWYLGLVHLQEHRTEQAGEALLTAVTFDPKLDEAAVSLAWVLGDLGRLPEATHYARQALAIKVQPDRLAQLGWFLLAQELWQEAEPLLSKALAMQPENTETRCHLSTTLQRLGRRDDALALLSEGLALSPDAPALLQQQVRLLRDLLHADAAREAMKRLLAQAPDDGANQTLAALIALDHGNVQAAAAHAEKAAALSPLSPEAWQALAQVRLLQKRPGEAAQALQTVLDLDPDHAADAHSQLGWIHHGEHRFGAAITAFTAAVEGNADDAAAWYGLAQAQHATEAFDAALTAINRAVQLRGDWLDAQILQARIRLNHSPATRDTALAQLRETLVLAPENAELRGLLVTALQTQEHYTEALQILDEGLTLSPDADDLLRQRIPLLLDLRRVDEAHAACHRLLQRQADRGTHWHLLSLVFNQQKKPGMALRALARARRLAPSLPEIWQQTGWLALETGDLRTAREAAARVLDLAPEATSSYILAALVQERCDDLQAAAEHAQKAIDRSPRSAAAWRALAQVRARQDRLDEAEAALRIALEREPQAASEAYRQLGWLHIKDHRFKDAIAAFSAAVESNAGDASAWHGLAEANRADGQFIDALSAIKKSLQLRNGGNGQHLRGQILHEQIHDSLRRNSHHLDATSQARWEPRTAPSRLPAPYDYVLCSLSTKSHLHLMKTLATSARQHFAGSIYLLVVDSDDTTLVPEGTTLVRRDDVIAPTVWNEMVKRYNILELCCALKSYLMRFLAKTVTCPIVYLDADTYMMAPLDRLLPEKPDFSVFLTPHLLDPMPEKRHADEIVMLAVGAYNGGMLAVGTHPDGVRFLDWWLDRVTRYAYDNREQGVFTDQKWLDLVPSFFRNVQVCQQIGLNVGHWQVQSEKDFAEDAAGRLTFLGERVSLMHMSGFKSNKPDLLAPHLRPPVSRDSALGRFLRQYAAETIQHQPPSNNSEKRVPGA